MKVLDPEAQAGMIVNGVISTDMLSSSFPSTINIYNMIYIVVMHVTLVTLTGLSLGKT